MELEDTNPSIIIPDPRDPRLGYLNNSNIHFPFVLENKTWPTVEHYILAKRFEGTMLEEEIRTSKSIYKARNLAKPRNLFVQEEGRVAKKTVYGSDKTVCFIRDDWNTVKMQYLEKAIRAKFTNKKAMERLLKTEGMSIVDQSDRSDFSGNSTGITLEKIRDEILNKNTIACKKKKKFSAPFADIKRDHLSEDEKKLVLQILKGADILKEIENLPSTTQTNIEIIEDVFCNFIGDVRNPEVLDDAIQIIQNIKNWTFERSAKWTEVTKFMPKYESVMRETEKIVRDYYPEDYPASLRVRVAIFIATIIRWLRMDATFQEKSSFFSKSKNIKKENFVLPPLRRSYRSSSVLHPQEPVKTKKNVSNSKYIRRGALYIEIFRNKKKLDPERFSKVVSHLEKMQKVERKVWLKRFQKLDIPEQNKELENIISKTSPSEKDA